MGHAQRTRPLYQFLGKAHGGSVPHGRQLFGQRPQHPLLPRQLLLQCGHLFVGMFYRVEALL